eukprot:63086-Hanusia_phi.AAC.1
MTRTVSVLLVLLNCVAFGGILVSKISGGMQAGSSSAAGGKLRGELRGEDWDGGERMEARGGKLTRRAHLGSDVAEFQEADSLPSYFMSHSKRKSQTELESSSKGSKVQRITQPRPLPEERDVNKDDQLLVQRSPSPSPEVPREKEPPPRQEPLHDFKAPKQYRGRRLSQSIDDRFSEIYFETEATRSESHASLARREDAERTESLNAQNASGSISQVPSTDPQLAGPTILKSSLIFGDCSLCRSEVILQLCRQSLAQRSWQIFISFALAGCVGRGDCTTSGERIRRKHAECEAGAEEVGERDDMACRELRRHGRGTAQLRRCERHVESAVASRRGEGGDGRDAVAPCCPLLQLRRAQEDDLRPVGHLPCPALCHLRGAAVPRGECAAHSDSEEAGDPSHPEVLEP